MHSVACRLDRCLLHHQDGSSFWRPGAMKNALRHGESLMGGESDRRILQVNQKPAAEHKEKLVFAIMLVPVELSMKDTQSHHGVVDPAEGLVGPLAFAAAMSPGTSINSRPPNLMSRLML